MTIARQTVLVLGAGASQPYGFPTGTELRDRISGMAGSVPMRLIFSQLGHDREEFDGFVNALRQSGYTSVDRFLENNPEWLDLGKKALAAVLLGCENAERLFPPAATGVNHWYETLANALDPGGRSFDDNRLAIVTFNYDRSLEHYLMAVFKARYHLENGSAVQYLKHINVVHVHGSLGALPEMDGAGIPYGHVAHLEDIDSAAKSISLTPEGDPTDPRYDDIQQAFIGAQRIVFLGFGFDPVNLQKLRIFDVPPADGEIWPSIYATGRGLTPDRWRRVGRDLLHHEFANPHRQDTVGAFLRTRVDLTYEPGPAH